MDINEQEVRKFVLEQLKRETEVLPVLAKEFPEDYEGITPKDSLRSSFKTNLALMQEGESGSYGERFYKRALEILMEEPIEEPAGMGSGHAN